MPDPFPPNYDLILNDLLAWGKSGLIPNTKVVKSYHPPVVDPVTGVPVLIPATVYETKDVTRANSDFVIPDATYKDKPVTYQQLIKGQYPSASPETIPDLSKTNSPVTNPATAVDMDSIPHFFYSGSNVKDFNINTTPGDLDTSMTLFSTAYVEDYKSTAQMVSDQSAYEAATADIRINTAADRLIRDVDHTLPRYVDNLEDANQFFTLAPREFPDPEYNVTGYPYIPSRYDLAATKVPCAIPGVLNCYMKANDAVDVSQPVVEYRPPNIDTYHVPDNIRRQIYWSQQFTGDGSTTSFTLVNNAMNKDAIVAVVDNQELLYLIDYTITKPDASGWKVNFTIAPDANSIIFVYLDDSKILKRMTGYDYYDPNPNSDTTQPVANLSAAGGFIKG